MKQIPVLLFTILMALGVNAQVDQEILIKSELESYRQLRAFKKSTVGDNYDVLYHRIHWNLNPHIDSMSGEVTTYFKTRTDNFKTISFDFVDGLTVDSVLYHGSKAVFSHTADVLQIDIGTLDQDVIDSVTVVYSGKPTETSRQGAYAREKRRPQNPHPVIWTLSEPYGAMSWWPCKQTLSDKIDSLDVFVTVPLGNKAATNGVLVDSVINDTFITYHWKHRYPIVTYLVAVAVTNYSQFSDYYTMANGDSLEILNYLYPESIPSMREPAKATVEIMGVFDSLFGAYPFALEKYGHAQFGRGGGMEHQTMSFMADMNFGLVAHELAHQWFGDDITCRTWSDLWLNEGFATFSTLLAYECLTPRETFLERAAYYKTNIFSEPGGSVFVQDTLNVSRLFSGRLTYYKGAILLSMLRFNLGDEVFYRAIRNYLEDPDHYYGFARTDDLIGHLEAVSGEDLTVFFDQWFYKEGFPIIDILWRKNGALYEINFRQTTSHESVDFFDVALPVRFYNNSRDTMITFRAENNNWTTVFSLDFEAENIEVDPNFRILAQTSVIRGDDLSNGITVYPNPAFDLVKFAGAPFSVEKIDIYTLTGARALAIDVETGGRRYGNIDVSSLSPGMYFLRIYGEGKSIAARFVVSPEN